MKIGSWRLHLEAASGAGMLAEWRRRLVARRVTLVVAGLLTCGYAAFGGLHWSLALAGLLATAGWAVLWPDAGGEARAQAIAHPSIQPRAERATEQAPPEAQPSAARPEAAAWQSMLAALPDPALVLDRDASVLGVNAPVAHISTAALGRHVSQAFRSPELLDAVERSLRTGQAQTCQIRTLVPVERHLLALVAPLPIAAGRLGEPALLVLLRDLTEQDRLTRMRADFVANASHELRTPLAALKGFIETMQGAASNDAPARERFLAIMQEQASRMTRLIDDLLSLSRIEMREHVAPTDRVDLAAVVASAAAGLRPLAVSAGITLALSPPPADAWVRGDRDELYQIAQNLIQNAIKYGRRRGRVDIALERDGERLALSVADDGIGIAPEHLPRLTERFYRVSAKDSRERGGTGLGLAIVKHIVNRHQGELRIDSAPGKGSRFTVALPLAPRRAVSGG